MRENNHSSKTKAVAALGLATLLCIGLAYADHNGLHTTPCNAPGTVGGGTLGNSPGVQGPPNSLGFDVGGGQCNGSFTITTDPTFPGAGASGLELGMRAEQRRVGQVANNNGDYTVLPGFDPGTMNRAWWNIQHSAASGGSVSDLEVLCFTIETQAGSAIPKEPTDLLTIRNVIDDRNNQPNATTTYADLYQTSQNPLFGWLTDGMGGPYNIFEEGAWRLYLTAMKDGQVAETSICIHTPNAVCAPAPPAAPTSAISSRALACLPADPGDPASSEGFAVQDSTGRAR